jgi:hypothetical protein
MGKLTFFVAIFFFNAFALAWNPFASHNDNEDVPLSADEMKRIQQKAGWSNDNDKTLLFEIRNDLSGPIQCAGAQVELNDGGHIAKGFTPKLFVPAGNSRIASIPGVQKGTMKSYSVPCSCFKKLGRGECINPLAKP